MKLPFEQVVAVHGDTVLRVCRVVVGFDDAEDAWAETFLSALRAYPDLPADANVQAWLVTIAHRKAIDITRLRRRQGGSIDDLPERPSRLGLPGSTDYDLWDAVGALPLKQRQAVAYHYLAGIAVRGDCRPHRRHTGSGAQGRAPMGSRACGERSRPR